MRLIFVLLCYVGFSTTNLYSQGLNYDSGVKGIWAKPGLEDELATDWKAAWIWVDESLEEDKILARRSFDLVSVPSKALLSITASFKYRLYVNGTYVGSGPSRSAPHHQYYDKLDISELLSPGKNTIAIEVHYLRGKLSYHRDGRAGLLLQLDYSENGESKYIATNEDWKVKADPSWSKDSPRISRFQLVPSDIVDLREKIVNWESPDFDDSQWDTATTLRRNEGWPSFQKNANAIPLTLPWSSLLIRDFPYVEEKLVNTKDIVYSNVVDTSELAEPILIGDFNSSPNSLNLNEVESHQANIVIFDFGSAISGMPKLVIEGAAGTEVEIRTAPFLVNNTFSHQVVFSNFVDRITLSGNKDEWEGFYFKPTRYFAVVVKGGQGKVNVDEVALRQISYPFESRGSMVSKDANWVNEYVGATVKTIIACTTDAYTDNYRERRQYAQTGYYGAMGNYWIFGDTHLQRRYLQQTAHEQKANGIMPAYGPLASDDYMVILDSNCLWIRSLRDFYLHSGDTISVKRLMPAAEKLMSLLHNFTNEFGLIDNPPYPYWLDHAVIDRRGANLNLNGHYLGALDDFAQVLDWLGRDDAEVFRSRAKLIRESVRENFWNSEKQLFADALIDGKQSDVFTEHGNAMALSMRIATQEQGNAICKILLEKDGHNFVKRANGMTVVTPAMSYFLHKGICEYGFIDESLEMFRDRFDKMLEPAGNQTLYEEWWLDATGRSGEKRTTSRSDAQTESCFPPALFGEYLLGVKATMPGMSEVEISKTGSGLKHIKGNIPSPLGLLTVEWQSTDKDSKTLRFVVPNGMKIKLDIQSLESEEIFINERLLNKGLKNESYFKLGSGEYLIKY